MRGIDTAYRGSVTEQRLWSTLQYLNAVSKALANGTEFHVALERIVALSVPAMFDAVHIAATHVDGRPPVERSHGAIDTESTLNVPLMIDGESLGCVYLWTAHPPDHIDRMIADDLATRLESLLNTARIIARQRHVADTLQRALLPVMLPQAERLAISAAYRPATDEATVGGDWYDVFELSEGKTAFSIGDVAGHGLDAAVVMGEVRQAFRAAAVNPKSPSLVLEHANQIVNMRADAVIVTAIFGIIDLDSSTVTYAVAGHPPPIIAPVNGQPQILPAMGMPLGVAESLQTCNWTITLAPGSIFALYTDGLIEHSRDLISGEVELLAAVGGQVHNNSHTPALDIVDAVFARCENVDDVATLVFRADDHMQDTFNFEFSALALAVPLLRRALTMYAQQLGLSPDLEHAVLLSVGEAAANAVEHACVENDCVGIVRVHAARAGGALVVEVRNDGSWKAAESREERGRGIPIMRSLSDHLEIKTTQTETVVRITFQNV